MTIKLVALVPVPPKFVALIFPVVEPASTVAVICVSLLIVKDAGVVLKLSAVTPVKFVPVITTEVPIGPLPGVNDVMVGGKTVVPFTGMLSVGTPFPNNEMTVLSGPDVEGWNCTVIKHGLEETCENTQGVCPPDPPNPSVKSPANGPLAFQPSKNGFPTPVNVRTAEPLPFKVT